MNLTYNYFGFKEEIANMFTNSDQFVIGLIILFFIIFEIYFLLNLEEHEGVGQFMFMNLVNVLVSFFIAILLSTLIRVIILFTQTFLIIFGIIGIKISLYYLVKYIRFYKNKKMK